MRSLFVTAMVSASLLCATAAQAAETYDFDPNHSQVGWSINHFGFSNPSGKIIGVTGSVTLDEKHPEKSSVSASIPVKDLLTGVARLDEHLKGKDFFDVAQFPTAGFTSTKVVQTGKDE